MKFCPKILRTDVTCLSLFDKYVISGMGGFISLHNVISSELVARVHVFHGSKLHGICKGADNYFIVFGGREIAVITCNTHDKNVIAVQSLWNVGDWIQCAHWLENENLAIATAHNIVMLCNWRTRQKILTAYCEEKCILYSSLFVGSTWEHLVLLAGTVFQEVVIWSPAEATISNSTCSVLHRLQGHKGVIFSSHYNPETGRIHTTSDDRSVKGWQVTPFVPCDWKHADIKLMYTLYGHKARVWKSLGLRNITLSIGEDSQVCVWNLKGNLVKRWSMHQSGSIWSIACCEQRGLMVTGGSDGGISVLSLDYCMKNLNPVLHIPIGGNLSPGDHAAENIPRRVVLLNNGHMIIILQSGHVMHCSLQQNKIETINQVIECDSGEYDDECYSYTVGSDGVSWSVLYYSPLLASYCLLEVSLCRKYIALASLEGQVYIFEACKDQSADSPVTKVLNISAAEGKIFSLQWLSSNKILICEANGKLTLWSLQMLEGSYHLMKEKTFILPFSKERWITAGLLLENFLLCGDRGGSIHLYSLIGEAQENIVPCQTLAKVHGRLGVSTLMSHGGHIYSTGRDGTLRQFQVLETEKQLEQLCINRMSFDWVASVCSHIDDIFVVGFSEKKFVMWTQAQQRLLFEVTCGGGHRSWDYIVNESCVVFVYIKHKSLFVTYSDLKQSMKPPIQTGFHPREVNCLQILNGNTKFPLLLSAGEDTTIHVSAAGTQNKLDTLVVLHSHISSVRTLACHAYSDHRILFFSAGGRAQIKAWELRIDLPSGDSEWPPKVLCQELSSHMLMDHNNRQSKSWKLLCPSIDPETRYMNVCIVSHDGFIFLGVGCSDGYFRIFEFQDDKHIFHLLGSFEFHRRCILNVTCVSPLKVLTMATDGIVAFWDLSRIIQKHILSQSTLNDQWEDPSSESAKFQPFSSCKIHQSGIDSFDFFTLDADCFLLATGGDDTALVLNLFQFTDNPVSVRQLLQWRMESAHTAQITGVTFKDKYLISTSVDQYVRIWKWICDVDKSLLLVTKIAEYCSMIPDIHGLKTWPVGDSFSVCLYGKGIEIIQDNAVEENDK